MAIDLMQTAIDPGAPAVPPQQNTPERLAAALEDTQGNILKSHGRDNSRHLFLTFTVTTDTDRAKAKAWIAKIARDRVTSAAQQWAESRSRARAFQQLEGTSLSPAEQQNFLLAASGPFVGLLLSAEGYRVLKLDERMPDDPSFLAGAAARAADLGDPAPGSWQPELRDGLHALLIVADDDIPRLEVLVATIQGELAGIASVFVQAGAVIRLGDDGKPSPTGRVHEHFGFSDGVSQPLFYAKDIEAAKKRSGGIDRYDPSAPLAQVLLKDPGGGESGYGSYIVYRKLKQDVAGFQGDEQKLGLALTQVADPKATKPTDDNVLLAGAYMVGRFKDGTPVVDQSVPGLLTQPNNFTYDQDVDGVRCPFQAHVRKANPRGDKQRQFDVPVTEERSRRIARRAISFGPPVLDPPPGEEVGLLFLCAQSSIIDQFEFIQLAWANYQDFLRPRTGLDPVIGQPGTAEVVAQPWPKEYGSHNQLDFSKVPPAETDPFVRVEVGEWVEMRGGEYFFAPSLSCLKTCDEA